MANQASSVELGAGLGPITAEARISSLDTLRGAALLGILLMNITGVGLPFAYVDPTVFGGAEGANLVVWSMNSLLVEGTMRGLFSMLFGAGIILMTSRAEARGGGIDVADVYYRRTLWLFLFGVVHSWLLLWIGDILYWYGIAGLFLFAFRKLRPKWLIALGFLALASVVPKHAYELSGVSAAWAEAQAAQAVVAGGGALTEEQQEAIDTWDEIVAERKHTPEQIEQRIEARRGNYFSIIAYQASELVYVQSTRFYLYTFWDVIGTMLIGMGLLKLGILSGERSVRFYLTTMLIGYAVGLTVNIYETRLIVESGFSILAFSQSTLTYDLGRIPVTLGHMSLIILLCKLGRVSWLMTRLAAVGRIALTNYVMQSLICVFIFTGLGFGLFGQLERYQLYYVVGGVWIFQLLISPIWLKYYRFGPLEWLWRSLTYLERQPFRRKQPVPGTAAGIA